LPLILIPARLAATRLPGKPLLPIHGQPMIVHVWRRAMEADLGPVVVATDDERIARAIEVVGGTAVMTRADHVSGTDRIAEALGRADPDRAHEVIVNFQGDLPTIAPHVLRETARLLDDPQVAIGTPVARITDRAEADAPSVVKLVGSPLVEAGRFRALYFTRACAPWGEGPLYHHIGLYVWRRAALERFVALPASPLECREKLEQLRALEAGMRIDADTQADLDRARAILAP
jgi:3-deoxy-manno-octulosonate cytidylyltransferase (CMP-KDO synthetase)